MQRRLTDVTFDPGPIDGVFGQMTLDAVLAFEKLHDLTRDGVMQPPELRRLAKAPRPTAPARAVATFVDVDVERQVLLEVVDGIVVQTLAVSTGNEALYRSASGMAVAHTPRGAFTILRKIEGWRVGPLGPMYYPSYFYDGYAIHGSSSVPAYPTSHGCVRIPIHSTIGFFERNPVGTPVFVHE
jgi:lipoprotein-anchoring transpeptidase ErfK/SrfK